MTATTATTITGTSTTALPPQVTPPPAAGTAPTVRPVATPADRAAWAAYVDTQPAGTLFHHPTWSNVVERVFGHTPQHRLAWRGGHVVGVLPLLEVHSLIAGTLLVSVPYGTYGGILADDADTCGVLTAAARELVSERRARLLDLRSATANAPDLPCDERYAAFTRPLPVDLPGLQTFLPRKARAAARQAVQREGLTVTHDHRLLRTVYDMYARSMRRLGSINYPYRFFTELAAELGLRAWVSVVWRGTTPAAGLLSFVYRDTVLPHFVGVDERVEAPGATNLLYFATMERAVKAQLAYFDFGRSRISNTGPFEFKRNQGFAPRTLGYQRYSPTQRTPDLSPTNPRFATVRRLWPYLPLGLTRPLGAWLARSIPG